MAVCEIVTIGTELLLGEIQDTNSRFIARSLRDIGVDLYRLTTVGDNLNRITAIFQLANIVETFMNMSVLLDHPAAAGFLQEPYCIADMIKIHGGHRLDAAIRQNILSVFPVMFDPIRLLAATNNG